MKRFFLEFPTFLTSWQDVYGDAADDCLRELQEHLGENPRVGNVIRNTGGLRKVRWAVPGRGGKSGGSRTLYFYVQKLECIVMIATLDKSDADNWTPAQRKSLKNQMIGIEESIIAGLFKHLSK